MSLTQIWVTSGLPWAALIFWNKLFSLSGSSLVAAPYADTKGKVVGVLGVIGPTHLNYARIIPMVDYTAKVVGRLLT